jgi:glutamyl-tRNA synthetase
VFNAEKLLWMNGVYIRELPAEELAAKSAPYLETALGRRIDNGLLARIVPLVRERIKVMTEIVDMADFFFIEGDLEYEMETLLGKRYAGQADAAAAALDLVVKAISGIDPWEHDGLEAAIRPLAEDLGVKTGDLFGLIRVAVTGKTATPPLFETMALLGRERTLGRLNAARERLRA